MITDKDREELKELTKQIRKSNQTMQWFDYGWDECAEILMQYVNKKCAEYADQVRKESAELKSVLSLWYEWSSKESVKIDDKDYGMVTQTAAILGDSAAVSTDSEKLAIAVKALGNIIDGNDLACERGESMASWMDSDFRRQAKDALKEIQG